MSRRDLTCRDFIDFIMSYLDGELAEEERTTFEGHLGKCPDCVNYLESYRETVRLGKAAFPDVDGPIPADVPEELITAVLAVRTRRS